MRKLLSSLLIPLLTSAIAPTAHAASNEATTQRHFASLVSGAEPKLAELSLFMTLMPKGGDLHHHYSGAIYAEQYLEWVDKQGYCVDKASSKIQKHRPDAKGCVSAQDVIADEEAYRELLQRWSSKDFSNHGAVKPPPDQQFFDTFLYFDDVASTNTREGLRTLKQRAIAENLGYIETIFELAPSLPDAGFERDLAAAGSDSAKLQALMAAQLTKLDADPQFNKGVRDYVANVQVSSEGIDDADFTMRYQAYVLRALSPALVFSQIASAYKIATLNDKVVAVNLVGAENSNVSMRDYSLHMQMFKAVKARYPNVKLALHAGELALGMVPPEGLKFHITEAVGVAGAQRIGHGIDISHERDALRLIQTLRERDIPIEVNLTSNEFILGVKGAAHPVELYRKHGVPFVISTDDTGVTRHTLSNEYVLFASRYKPTYAEVKKLSYDSLRYAFLPEADKQRLKKQLDTRFAKFEADIAASESRAQKPVRTARDVK
ncbi:adenosine deaminase [Archangium sp. Cb G35]|uniref:adenosine deaminase family protein n=1 Tax=Archangium sp. Cb G35 TaxID=1920190 RepID=UPI0009368D88|nr:adenosine deaminase [Archangium sp. Cb G35]OJT18211.1 adenosine deaminase [Archangium sp. Cb G35]